MPSRTLASVFDLSIGNRQVLFSGVLLALTIGACGTEGPGAENAAAKRGGETNPNSLRPDGGSFATGCVPKTCPPNANCGVMDDGCGKRIACGGGSTSGSELPDQDRDFDDEDNEKGDNQPSGFESCGDGDEGGGVCDPKTFRCTERTSACAASGAECGVLLDPCGLPFQCGTCGASQYCDVKTNKCVPGNPPPPPPPANCAALSCQDSGGTFCGSISNACGETIECGACPAGQTCGGGGIPFRCGTSPECAGKQCGFVMNACGSAAFNCGTCGEDQECGDDGICHGEGTPKHEEPEGPCTPTTADPCAGKQCGWGSDGCSSVSCGGCGASERCSGYSCVACTLIANPCAGKTCGHADDGCGNYVSCGTCSGSDTCSGGQCQTCTPDPNPCAGKTCGTAYDGCGNSITCGSCGSGQCVGGTCCQPINPCTGVAGIFSNGCGGTVTCVGGGGPASPH